MREILFRGKRKLNNEWIEGSLHTEKFTADEEFLCCEVCQCDVYPETVGQYTGLTDKNGNKIFEGDILKGAWKTILTIFFDEISSSYRVKTSTGHEREPSYYGLDKLEVIGNIYDNPEMLNTAKCGQCLEQK